MFGVVHILRNAIFQDFDPPPPLRTAKLRNTSLTPPLERYVLYGRPLITFVKEWVYLIESSQKFVARIMNMCEKLKF
jgi:hypothetical protein